MEIPKYFYYRVRVINKGTGVEIEDASDVDVVEVVRCKDCKYYLNSNEKCGLVDTRLRFYETDKVWTEDSFCAWGERREDGKTD